MLVASFSSRPQPWPPWFGLIFCLTVEGLVLALMAWSYPDSCPQGFGLVLHLCLRGFGLILGFSLEDLVWALGVESM